MASLILSPQRRGNVNPELGTIGIAPDWESGCLVLSLTLTGHHPSFGLIAPICTTRAWSPQFLSLLCVPTFHVYSDYSTRCLNVYPGEDEGQGRPADL